MQNRLQKLLTKEGIAPTRFAEVIGVQRSSISHILSGRNKPSFDMIQSILEKYPKINPDWLILGKGEMYRKVVQTSLFDSITATPTQTHPAESNLTSEDTSIPKIAKASENRISEKRAERVIVFYNDKSFSEYTPE